MEQNREKAIGWVLEHEGGFTNHPSDPGGPTNFGITIHDARMYLNNAADVAFMKAMQKSDAIAIYRAKYWDKVRGDELPTGLDYTLMDYGVNSGVGRAIKVLQRKVRTNVDGVFGPMTLKAMHDYVDAYGVANLITTINDERLDFLKALRTWPVFGKGWGRRVADVKKRSLEMAKGE